ncbi:MAG: hypothetical protein FWG87_14720 [Defluviitaleaceae bacterium]|nr:hypothetical protein [Defluviitaleaceae bacterium]
MGIAVFWLVATAIIFFVACVGLFLLQIFLSRKERRWLGLILPTISLLISMIPVFGYAAFTETSSSSVQSVDGVFIYEAHAPSAAQPIESAPALIVVVLTVFILYNIPTVVFLSIYFACRGKRNRIKAVEKMSVQDL